MRRFLDRGSRRRRRPPVVCGSDRSHRSDEPDGVSQNAGSGGQLARRVIHWEPFSEFVLTITADNGREFAGHREFGAALGGDVYFARPYHSWERGLNEHTNGLVRQYFGKGKSLLGIDPAKLQRVADLLNGPPRKALGFRTPAEVFAEAASPAA